MASPRPFPALLHHPFAALMGGVWPVRDREGTRNRERVPDGGALEGETAHALAYQLAAWTISRQASTTTIAASSRRALTRG